VPRSFVTTLVSAPLTGALESGDSIRTLRDAKYECHGVRFMSGPKLGQQRACIDSCNLYLDDLTMTSGIKNKWLEERKVRVIGRNESGGGTTHLALLSLLPFPQSPSQCTKVCPEYRMSNLVPTGSQARTLKIRAVSDSRKLRGLDCADGLRDMSIFKLKPVGHESESTNRKWLGPR
jgi:hypothetical protein